jgi:recombinational DNA repair protein (RecF pathway)
LRRELGWLQQASYATELLEQTTETETPLPEFFALLSGFLRNLPEHPPQPQTVFAFEMKLLRELGQSPDLAASKLTPGSKQILERLGELDWAATSCVKPSTSQSREVQQFLHAFLIHHLGKVPNGRGSALA